MVAFHSKNDSAGIVTLPCAVLILFLHRRT
jgi:hypothetical protein